MHLLYFQFIQQSSILLTFFSYKLKETKSYMFVMANQTSSQNQ